MKINELELCLSNVLPTVRNIVYTMTQFICKKREKKRELSHNYILIACGAHVPVVHSIFSVILFLFF